MRSEECSKRDEEQEKKNEEGKCGMRKKKEENEVQMEEVIGD